MEIGDAGVTGLDPIKTKNNSTDACVCMKLKALQIHAKSQLS
jgi:hypothetical protein